MAFIPVPNTVMVEAVYEWAGQTVENTMYFQFAGGEPTEVDISALLASIRGLIETDLLPLLSTTIALVRVVGTLLSAVDALSVTLALSPPSTGGVTDEAMPNNVTYCITFLTSQRGRSFRGRNYIPGLPQAAVNGNNIAGATRTGLLAFYNELQTTVQVLDWSMVVVSRFANNVPRVTGVVTNINAFTTFDDVVDSQRRRLPGRGT